MAISDSIGHQPRAKVTSNVDRIASLPTKARAEAKDEEKQTKWKPFVALQILSAASTLTHLSYALTLGTPLLLGSFSANITNISNVLAMNSEKNWLVLVKNGCA